MPPSALDNPQIANDGTIYVGYQQYLTTNSGCAAGVQNVLAVSTDYQAYSTDQEDTWTEYPVAQVQTQPSTFIGDYHGLAGRGGRILGMWFDSRDNSSGDPYTHPNVE